MIILIFLKQYGQLLQQSFICFLAEKKIGWSLIRGWSLILFYEKNSSGRLSGGGQLGIFFYKKNPGGRLLEGGRLFGIGE